MEKGWYYSQEKHGVEICHWDSDHKIWDSIFGSDEVLAPVPSYEEWQAKLEENTKLKELLKECRKSFNKLKGDTVWYPYEVDECIAKIDEALQ